MVKTFVQQIFFETRTYQFKNTGETPFCFLLIMHYGKHRGRQHKGNTKLASHLEETKVAFSASPSVLTPEVSKIKQI